MMPEHDLSSEAGWLLAFYDYLDDYEGQNLDGQWIAVVGEEIVDHDSDPEALALRVAATFGPGTALFASVVMDRIA